LAPGEFPSFALIIDDGEGVFGGGLEESGDLGAVLELDGDGRIFFVQFVGGVEQCLEDFGLLASPAERREVGSRGWVGGAPLVAFSATGFFEDGGALLGEFGGGVCFEDGWEELVHGPFAAWLINRQRGGRCVGVFSGEPRLVLGERPGLFGGFGEGGPVLEEFDCGGALIFGEFQSEEDHMPDPLGFVGADAIAFECL
ncbi:MAG: hypothetical protein RL215_2028, partial [Planctomycetota bacterium]